MPNLDEGHRLLKDKKYLDAYNYFFINAEKHKEDEHLYNGCLYGQARALLGLNNLAAAQAILRRIIQTTPSWQTPYITLARSYEQQGNVTEAFQTYMAALEQSRNTNLNDKLQGHFDWFLGQHSAHLKTQQFAPSYTALNQSAPVSYVPTAQTDANPKPRLYLR